MSTSVDMGVYSVPEAARLAQVARRTASRWIAGSAAEGSPPVLKPDLPKVGDRWALSFLDLIDLLVVGRFRERGVSLQLIRRVYTKLAEDLSTKHPFSHQRLLTDGRTVFLETVNHIGDKNLQEVLTGQGAMPEVLKPYLKQIEYAPNEIAARWHIAQGVVVDPKWSFGKPVVAEAGVATFVLARSYWANNQDAELVADLFDVSVEAVRLAADFEQTQRPRRAA